MHDQGDGPNSIQKRGSVAETQKKPSMEDGWREANNDLRYNRSRAEANSGRPKEVGQGGQAKDQKTQTGAEIVSEFIVGVLSTSLSAFHVPFLGIPQVGMHWCGRTL